MVATPGCSEPAAKPLANLSVKASTATLPGGGVEDGRGARGRRCSCPPPACATPASSSRAMVSSRAAEPQSMAWLLAMLTTSMPAEASPSASAVRLRKVYSFQASLVPLSEMGPSRLTKARSAVLR